MSNAIAVIQSAVNGNAIVNMNAKGKQGSFARAIAFASRDERIKQGQLMYAHWLSNGQFRPLVNDIIDVLVAKSARPLIKHIVPETGPVKRDALVLLCEMVSASVRESNKELKGEKAFVYGFVSRIAEDFNPTTVEA